jgi:predicted transglutaminase-like cysteine proteinase
MLQLLRLLSVSKRGYLLVLTGCFLLLAASATARLNISNELLEKIEKKYDAAAKQRVLNWQQLINSSKDKPENEQLKLVNDFFNQQVEFIEDLIHWQTKDYWATPLEFLTSGAGDCEDYSIAKYFTLRELGVSEKKLRLTYVKAINLRQAHMVLTYFPKMRSIPLVLDNLIVEIKPASERKDLMPVYSFNGSGLWIAKARGKGKRIGSSTRLSLWQDLKNKMLRNEI